MKTRLLFLNQCFDKTRLRNLIAWVLFTKGEKETIEIVEKLKGLGFQFATRAGISLSIDDLKIPSEKVPLVSQAKQQVALATSQYEKGNVTSIEKLQQLVDTWHRTSETLKQTVVSNFQATDKLSPVYMMAFSGARGNISQVRQLAGMRGLMADPQGQIIGFPIRSNFREGLTLTEYMISCYGARKGLVDTALRTADAGYLTRRLVDVSQHMVVKASTCATRRGIVLYDLAISGKSVLSLRDRLVGRVLAQDVYALGSSRGALGSGFRWPPLRWPGVANEPPAFINVIDDEGPLKEAKGPFQSPKGVNRKIKERQETVRSPRLMNLLGSGPLQPNNMAKVGERNQEISANLASQIASVQKRVSVRSPLTCSIRHGVCQLCYGWSLSEGRLVNLGEAVGIIAAQSIGEPGTQLTMRTFHTGGVFSGDVMTEIRAPYEGTAHFSNPLQGLLIRTSHGKIAFLTKSSGKVAIQPNQHQGFKSYRPKDKKNINYMDEKGDNIIKDNTLEGSPKEFLQPKLEETLFALEASTVVFVRQHEKVLQTQLIAEFSSMGTEINETIEAKRTLFANNAGQISFASLLIGKRIRDNGDIVRVSRDLGFVWILSGKQPGPVALLDLFQRGTHIVNQNTIVTKAPCLDSVETSLLGSKKDVLEGPLGFGPPQRSQNETAFVTWKSPVKIVLLGSKTTRVLVTGFEALVAVRKFLPSILYSWIRLTNNKSFTGNKSHLASSNQHTTEGWSQSLSSTRRVWCGNRNADCQQVVPVLFRPILLDKEAGINPVLGIATSPVREAKPPQRPALLSTSSTFNQSALCKQPYLSYSPLAVAHSLSIKRAFGKGVTSDNTSVWIFPSQYQTSKNGLAWFDSRYLSQRLNLGEVIWIETEAAPLHRSNPVATVSARTTSRITAVNPLAGQPSTYSKLDKPNVETLYNEQIHPLKGILLQKVREASQKERGETKVKTYLNQTPVSSLRRGEAEYLVTSTHFPNLFAKEGQVPWGYLVNKKAQQQTSSRAVVDTSAKFAHSRHQYKKATATKSWVVTFEKRQNFRKQKALNLQKDYFFREPVINKRVNNVTMPQREEDHFFLFKDVDARKKMSEGSTEQIDRQQKKSYRWIYCPQHIQKLSTLHESINFYRNRQFDKLSFDSSLVYIRAWFNLELLYSVKNNLDCIASKLFLFSERNTTFRQASHVTSPPLVQTVQREMNHWRPRFLSADFTNSTSAFQFKSHPFWASCQDVSTTRQYSSLYHNLTEHRESKPLDKSNQARRLSSPNTPYIVSQCNNRFLLHFAGFKDAASLDVPPEMRINGRFGLKNGLRSLSGPLGWGPLNKPKKGSESRSIGHIRPFAKGRALDLGFRSQLKSLDVFPQQRMRGFNGHSQASRGFVKKEGLLFLRKLMQVPQGYALHERAISFDKWDEALSLAEVLQTERKEPNFMESGTQFNPRIVKISVRPDLKIVYKLSFDARNCFHLPQYNELVEGPLIINDIDEGRGFIGHPWPTKGWPSKPPTQGVLKIRSNTLETLNLQETGKTERYKFLVWRNLMNCKPFLLLRTCSLQVQVVSNTKARYFLPLSVEHPLTWHSLVYSLDLLRENLETKVKVSQQVWRKAESSTRLPVVGELGAVQNNLEALEYRGRQKGFLHQLGLRQQIALGPLPLETDRREVFFDSLTRQKIEGQPQVDNRASGVWETPPIIRPSTDSSFGVQGFDGHPFVGQGWPTNPLIINDIDEGQGWPTNPRPSSMSLMMRGPSRNRMNVQSCGDVNQRIAKVQQKRVSWPYSPQATLLTVMSKGSPISLPSRTKLTLNYTTQSDAVVTEGTRPLPRTGFANVLQHKIDENNPFTLGKRGREAEAPTWLNSRHLGLPLRKRYGSLLKFGAKIRRTPLITNHKPNPFSLASLLLTSNFCTKVVSSNSYLIRFLGTINLSSANRGCLVTSSKRNEERLSPAMGELVSQDSLHDGRYLGMSTSLSKSSNTKGNTVLLTESDQVSMSLSKQKTNVSVGQFVTLGEEFVSKHAALVSGQVVAIEQDKLTLRRTQALLFYAQGVTHVNNGQWVNKNAPILTLTYQKLVTGDIVQGIPKIEQFFEAPATRDGEPLSNSLQSRLRKTYNRLKTSLPHVQAVKHSLEEIQQVLVEGILRVYLSQGVRIADKHLEIVIRQMTSKGQILDVGNTGLFQGEFVNLDRIERINLATYGQKAEYEPSVLGITQASLGAESFISAASFQETTRVLSRDTIVGKTDFLRGLKERVVLGDVIQAGTGLDDNINYGLLFGATET